MIGSRMFTRGFPEYQLNVDVLIIDEASQATWPAVIDACIVTNPERMIFGGDSKQLTPFSRSEEGEEILQDSPIHMASEATPDAIGLQRICGGTPESLMPTLVQCQGVLPGYSICHEASWRLGPLYSMPLQQHSVFLEDSTGRNAIYTILLVIRCTTGW